MRIAFLAIFVFIIIHLLWWNAYWKNRAKRINKKLNIAIVNYTVSKKVKKDLIDMGIQLEKIVVMDPNVISIESVEKCLSMGF